MSMLSHPSLLSPRGGRSEEHTSELQSQSNLVCRLLLEKKNKQFSYSKQRPRLQRKVPLLLSRTLSCIRFIFHCTLIQLDSFPQWCHGSLDYLIRSSESTVLSGSLPPASDVVQPTVPSIARHHSPRRYSNDIIVTYETTEQVISLIIARPIKHPLFFLNNPAPTKFHPFPLPDALPN